MTQDEIDSKTLQLLTLLMKAEIKTVRVGSEILISQLIDELYAELS